MSNYQLKTADHYNIPIGNVKKLIDYVIPYENLQFSLKLRLKLKNYIGYYNSIAKTICWTQHTKKNRIKKKENSDKDGKLL